MNNLILIGLPGCGKSTLGRLTAEALGREWIDLDTEIERTAGCPIPTLFAQEGEDGFRQRETAACRLAAKTLAAYAGANGMVGGQVIDLKSENTNAPLEVLREMDYKKTACLIKAACELGCIAANADDEQRKAASLYGECIGIAFQIQDDILDRTSTDAELGKPVGSDVENSKSTYASLLGIERCRELVDELTQQALEALGAFRADTTELKNFALDLAKRTN